MKDLFIPYELALLAKEKGFDEPCIKGYNQDGKITLGYYMEDRNSDARYTENKGHATAPLYQQIVDWFREYEIKIIEDRDWGWGVHTKCSSDTYYNLYKQCVDIDTAIIEAFKLI